MIRHTLGKGAIVDYPLDVCLHEHIQRAALRTPGATAVVFEGQELSYVELERRTNQLARHLLELGVQPDSMVATYMERSLELIVALVATLKAGGAYVPIDPDYPHDRTRFMIEDAEAPVLLTQEKFLANLPPVEGAVLCVDSGWSETSKFDESSLARRADADGLAYMIYTSGSTGRPKGAMNAHRGICNRLLWMRDEYRVDHSDVVLQKTPFSFDVSVWELFLPLICGARLIFARPGGHRDPHYLVELIRQHGVTMIHFVPSMLGIFLDEPDLSGCTSLRHVICSGEALSTSLQKRFFSRLDTNLHNLYGPTEAAVDVTHWKCERDSETPTVPIGRPVANTNIYILDDTVEPVPVGEEGELYIGGVQVGRGYWKRPELTAERFVPDPFSSGDGARLYRTGDVARYLPDGSILFLGRRDHQVKVRGFRIELEEIESVLSSHDAVSEAVVVAREQEDESRKLVAYVVPDPVCAFTVRKVTELERRGPVPAWKPYELPNGMVVSHLNRSETDFTFKEVFEENAYLRNGITVSHGDCVVDVGANIGLFSLFAATKMKTGIVYALEPVPPIFAALELNCGLYDFDIKTLPYGLSREPGRDWFTFYPHVSIVSGRFADLAEEKEMLSSYLAKEREDDLTASVMDELLNSRLESQRFQCELKTLSSIMREQNIERIDLIKVDAEKSELEVLAGIDDDDWKKIRQVVVEVHDVDGRLDSIRRLLDSHGFRITVDQEPMLARTDLHMVYALRESSAVETALHSEPHESTKSARPRWFRPSQLASDVKQFAATKLPEYMVPAAIVVLDRMPLTPNGKLDRNALPSPASERPLLEQKFVAPSSPLEGFLAELWCDVLKIDRVGVHDRFFELGGDSIQGAQLVNRLQRELDEFVYVVTLFEAPTIAEYAKLLESDYPDAVRRRFHEPKTGAPTDSKARRVDATMIESLRKCVPVSSERQRTADSVKKNPPALFILAPPRSGTTLLRVMLAGHPKLFAAPELQLLGFGSLAERRAALVGRFSAWLEGTVRTLMELKCCDADGAKRLMEAYESQGLTTQQFFAVLQNEIGDRLLVDKSPSYALDLEALRKAERDFRDPLYVHLVRHPYAVVKSFEEIHMDQVLYLRPHEFSPRQLGELVWTLSHQNIVEFLDDVPENRKFRMKFEDLVGQPRNTMEKMFRTLGLDFHRAVLEPYANRERKMTDGIYAASTPMGDVKFDRYPGIEPSIADRWREVASDDFLGDVTWALAGSLGYRRAEAAPHEGAGTDIRSRRETMRARRRRRRTHREA